MDASHPEILFYYTVIIPVAPQETVGDAGIEPGTAALQSGVTLVSSRLSHHIPLGFKVASSNLLSQICSIVLNTKKYVTDLKDKKLNNLT
jgi:hypothetical protein